MKAFTTTIAAAVLWAAAGSGSASASDPAVELVNEASSVAGCQRLSEVRGKSAWGGVFAAKSYDWALSQLKEQAAKAGATHVLLLNATSGYTGSNMLGVAYRCSTSGEMQTITIQESPRK